MARLLLILAVVLISIKAIWKGIHLKTFWYLPIRRVTAWQQETSGQANRTLRHMDISDEALKQAASVT